jgi:hypothetical protein
MDRGLVFPARKIIHSLNISTMKIQFISEQEHSELLNIFNDCPALTLQNKGYEYIDKSKLTDDEKSSLERVSEILRKSVVGFSSFSNFRLDKNGEVEIRLQYDYGAEDNSMPFTGVGYVLLDELRDGFKDPTN